MVRSYPYSTTGYVLDNAFLFAFAELVMAKVCSLLACAAVPPCCPAEVRKLRVFTTALVSFSAFVH